MGPDANELAIETEVNRRVAGIVKDQDIQRELSEIKQGLQRANGLKALMFTKDDFRQFEERLKEQLSSFITVQALGDGDFWVKHGLVRLEPDDQEVLRHRLELDRVAEANRHAERVEDTVNAQKAATRAYIASAIFAGAMVIVAVLAWIHPKFG